MCSPGPTQYIFHTSMTRYSLFVLKVSLNTNKPNQILCCGDNRKTYFVCICVVYVAPKASAAVSADNQEESSDMITITGVCCVALNTVAGLTQHTHAVVCFMAPSLATVNIVSLFSEFYIAMAAGKRCILYVFVWRL